mgnify:CR=1 FL=1
MTYPAIYGVLEKAHATNNLTDFGKALYERLEPFKKNVFYKEGDLTQIGYRQTREIAGGWYKTIRKYLKAIPI